MGSMGGFLKLGLAAYYCFVHEFFDAHTRQNQARSVERLRFERGFTLWLNRACEFVCTPLQAHSSLPLEVTVKGSGLGARETKARCVVAR